jgi:formylglycine-generating enzyme required for sulfatase activity
MARGPAPKLSEAPAPVQGNEKAVSHVLHGVCGNRKQGRRRPAYRSRQEVDGAEKI